MIIAVIALVVVVGVLVVYILIDRTKGSKGDSSIDESSAELREVVNTLITQTQNMSEQVSTVTASKSSEAVGKELGEQLGANFKLLDERFKPLENSLAKYERLINSLKEESSRNQGELSEQLKAVEELNRIFTNTKARGNWGEEQAENILDTAGFKRDIDYFTQKSFPSPNDSSGSIKPDFTFKLPEGSILHMDAKFSLDNYLKALDSDAGSAEAKSAAKNFIRDVKAQIKNLYDKKYTDTEGSVNQMLMFLPNESAFSFLMENEEGIIGYALEHRIMLCSPMTLFAILRIIRQSVRTVELQKASNQILNEHDSFRKEWEKFSGAIDDLGKSLNTAQKKYEDLSGTRRRQLQKPIDRIENLKAIEIDNEIDQSAGELGSVGELEAESQDAGYLDDVDYLDDD